eukprot:12769919-Alexandrium_andersonii.AAC.1
MQLRMRRAMPLLTATWGNVVQALAIDHRWSYAVSVLGHGVGDPSDLCWVNPHGRSLDAPFERYCANVTCASL